MTTIETIIFVGLIICLLALGLDLYRHERDVAALEDEIDRLRELER